MSLNRSPMRGGAENLGWKDHKKFNRYFDRLEEQGKVQLGVGDLMEVVK